MPDKFEHIRPVTSNFLSDRLARSLPPAVSLAGVSVFLLMLGAWLLTHRYPGIERDALHYNAFAILEIRPDPLSNDMSLNGHISASLFPPIYAFIVSAIGPPMASLVSVVTGVVLWFLAVARLSWALAGNRWIAVAGVFCVTFLFSFYGFWYSIRYGEPILTPRLFAEAGMMMAFAAWVSGRNLQSAIWSIASLLIHPLMAGPAILVLTTLQFGARIGFFCISALGAVALLTLALLGISPFDHLLISFDPEWLEALGQAYSYAFIENWTIWSLYSHLLPLCILLIASVGETALLRRFSRAVLLVAGTFTFTGWLLGDVLNNVLIMNLVLWRSLWLVMVFGNLFAIFVAAILPVRNTVRVLLVGAIVLNILETGLGRFPIGSSALALSALLMHLQDAQIPAKLHTPLRRVTGLTLVTWLLFSLSILIIDVNYAVSEGYLFEKSVAVMVPLFFFAAFSLQHAFQEDFLPTLAIAVIAGIALGFAACKWDNRNPWQRFVESGPRIPAEISHVLRNRNVYWEGGPLMQWIALNEPSFFSCIQSAPMLNDRDVAVEFARRGLIIRELNTLDFRDKDRGYCLKKLEPDSDGPQSAEQIRKACQALPDLDVLALYNPVEGARYLKWTLPERAWPEIPGSATEEQRQKALKFRSFFLYECEFFRG